MPKKSAKNNDLLKSVKADASPQVYNIVLNLVNQEREDLAEIVLKVDYLLDYASTCIRQKDYEEAAEPLTIAKTRIDRLAEEKVDTEPLEYLYEGIMKKVKK